MATIIKAKSISIVVDGKPVNLPTTDDGHIDPLHPTGKCRCAGEGTCEWCTTPTICGCTNATCGGCGDGDDPDLAELVVHKHKAHYDVYIGRPSKWGNPFSHKPGTLAKYRVASREEAITRYREWLLAQPDLVAQAKQELRGKVLGCWCAPLPCHGDVLAEIANAPDAASDELAAAQLEVALTLSAPAVAVLDRAEDALARLRYPLYCVDRSALFNDAQFIGPYTTHEEAQQHAGPDDLIARCRRLRPSEVQFCYDDVLDWPDAETVCEVIEQHITRDGDIPDPAWYSFAARRIVHVEYDDGTLPTERDAKAWCDEHLRIDVYICEGDE